MSLPKKSQSKPDLQDNVPAPIESSEPNARVIRSRNSTKNTAGSSCSDDKNTAGKSRSAGKNTAESSRSVENTADKALDSDENTTGGTTKKKTKNTGIARSSTRSEPFQYQYRYLPAMLHHTKRDWQVEFHILNPDTNLLERKRIRLNLLRKHCRTTAEFKVRAAEIVQDINAKLAGGWTPFGESENTRYYTPISQVLERYVAERSKELKKETMRSYKSFVSIFGKWIDKELPGCKALYFNRTIAVRYMDWYYEKHSNPNTYNNMLKLARAFFGWAKEKCYIKENPFELMKTKRKQEKRRILIPKEQRTRICEYYEQKRPEMVLVCALVYTSLIRPIEITRITVDMLHLKDGYIALPQEITKNGNGRNAPLSADLILRLATHIQHSKSGDYLFGTKWAPDKCAITSKAFRKQWEKMRKALGLPDEMQLYSLRDTGIFDKIKSGVDPLTVMQAADHHDLAMTTRYANHYDPNMVRIIAEADDF